VGEGLWRYSSVRTDRKRYDEERGQDAGRRSAAGRPNPRQGSDAARAVSEADFRHARARRPLRRAEAIDPHRHELPLLRRGRVFVYGEAEAVTALAQVDWTWARSCVCSLSVHTRNVVFPDAF
jgi:hypothetical protein